MTPRVRLQIAQLGEGLLATRMSTPSIRRNGKTPSTNSHYYYSLVRLVARVGTNVLLQVTELGELPLADFATVRFDAQMDPGVLG